MFFCLSVVVNAMQDIKDDSLASSKINLAETMINLKQTFITFFCKGWTQKASKDITIKSARPFHTILAKEQARADWNNHIFSLVSFQMRPQSSDIDPIHSFVQKLKKQIRTTDDIGWLDNHSIGVLHF